MELQLVISGSSYIVVGFLSNSLRPWVPALSSLALVSPLATRSRYSAIVFPISLRSNFYNLSNRSLSAFILLIVPHLIILCDGRRRLASIRGSLFISPIVKFRLPRKSMQNSTVTKPRGPRRRPRRSQTDCGN